MIQAKLFSNLLAKFLDSSTKSFFP